MISSQSFLGHCRPITGSGDGGGYNFPPSVDRSEGKNNGEKESANTGSGGGGDGSMADHASVSLAVARAHGRARQGTFSMRV